MCDILCVIGVILAEFKIQNIEYYTYYFYRSYRTGNICSDLSVRIRYCIGISMFTNFCAFQYIILIKC